MTLQKLKFPGTGVDKKARTMAVPLTGAGARIRAAEILFII
jgi:hypothetical protein